METSYERSECQPTSLLDLPLEIRLQVYKYVFENNHFTIWDMTGQNYFGSSFRFQHAILHSCRQVYKEAKLLLCRAVKVRLINMSQKLSFKISLLRKLIPTSVLENATTIECNIQALYKHVALEEFPSLKALHLRERHDINEINDIPCWKRRLLME